MLFATKFPRTSPGSGEHKAGLAGGWPGFILFAAGALLLLLVLPWRLRALRAGALEILQVALLAGAAFALYGMAILLTEVVNAILLFYLTPVWSTLLMRFVLGVPVTRARALVLICGFGGLAIILSGDGGWPWPRNAGDWMALISGALWACGTFVMYRGVKLAAFEQVLAFAAGGALCALLLAYVIGALALGASATGSAASGLALERLSASSWTFVAVTALLLVPTNFLMMFGVNRLDPGRVGVLLMLEVVVGVISASLYAGEPFGTHHGMGAVLIIGAGLTEVLYRPYAPGN
ncbi:MAG: EamA family transporter [Gammaproteobacteria bacterium]|nr:EamA family transporter [Gammaproteobacteria bacterium]